MATVYVEGGIGVQVSVGDGLGVKVEEGFSVNDAVGVIDGVKLISTVGVNVSVGGTVGDGFGGVDEGAEVAVGVSRVGTKAMADTTGVTWGTIVQSFMVVYTDPFDVIRTVMVVMPGSNGAV